MTENKRIFTFWEPSQKMPAYIRLCIQTWKKFLPEYEVIILDYSNIDKWIEPNFYDKILYTDFTLPKQADAIRCAVLSKHGGIWMDADTIITSEKIKDIINIDSDFVLLSKHICFIVAKKNSYILKKWQNGIKYNLKKYSFINEVVNLNNKQTSGTELFYNYLLSLDANNKINQDYFKEFVEATRSADVWDLESSLIDLGRSLGTLHSILGPEAYISIFSNNEIKEHFYIDKMYLSIINSADKDKENYVDSCLDKVLITKYQNYNIGVSLSENYRSFVGNSIASKYKDLIDFALIINLQKMKCSLRGIKDDIDLGKVAQSFAQNGGGHKKAAGFYINDECIDIIEKFVVEYIRSKK